MPSLITHYLFCQQYLKNNTKELLLGAQGPDPFFYYGYLNPFRKNIKDVRNFGNYLHDIDPFISFSFMLNYIRNQNTKEKNILFEYFKGMVAHYILDRNCHPMVFYFTGFKKENSDDSVDNYMILHSTMETSIDVLYQEKLNIHPSYNDLLSVKKDNLKIISKMLYKLALHLKQDNIYEDSFYIAVNHMKKVNKIINSKLFGFRKFIFNKFLKNSMINTMSHPLNSKKINYDFLNLNHSSILDCIDNSYRGNDDFYMLCDKAGKELNDFLKICNDIYVSNMDVNLMKAYLNEIDHSGFKVNSKMKYYNLIIK